MAKMNAEVKAEWVAALRSGEYKQAQGQLAYRDGENEPWTHCCLGVLCELAVKAGLPIEVKDSLFDRDYDEASALLPQSVVAWAGFDKAASPSGAVEFPDGNRDMIDLTARNDNGTPFTEIADLIEKYL